jgi:tRNA threonylcarbamoyladenosine biosynthesis protein TsaB
MKLLAIETSSEAWSVALQIGDEIMEEHVVAPREHTKILMPMIRQMLADAAVVATDLDALVLGNGPGSFIGMRIGASVAQGLCYAAGLQLIPVSSLAAVAAETVAKRPAAQVVVAQDARMHEVYVGIYAQNDDARLQLVGQETIQPVGQIAEIPAGAVAAGMAWQKYPELCTANLDRLHDIVDITRPRAVFLLPAGRNGLETGRAIAPERLAPAYLRSKVAEKLPGNPAS